MSDMSYEYMIEAWPHLSDLERWLRVIANKDKVTIVLDSDETMIYYDTPLNDGCLHFDDDIGMGAGIGCLLEAIEIECESV